MSYDPSQLYDSLRRIEYRLNTLEQHFSKLEALLRYAYGYLHESPWKKAIRKALGRDRSGRLAAVKPEKVRRR